MGNILEEIEQIIKPLTDMIQNSSYSNIKELIDLKTKTRDDLFNTQERINDELDSLKYKKLDFLLEISQKNSELKKAGQLLDENFHKDDIDNIDNRINNLTDALELIETNLLITKYTEEEKQFIENQEKKLEETVVENSTNQSEANIAPKNIETPMDSKENNTTEIENSQEQKESQEPEKTAETESIQQSEDLSNAESLKEEPEVLDGKPVIDESPSITETGVSEKNFFNSFPDLTDDITALDRKNLFFPNNEKPFEIKINYGENDISHDTDRDVSESNSKENLPNLGLPIDVDYSINAKITALDDVSDLCYQIYCDIMKYIKKLDTIELEKSNDGKARFVNDSEHSFEGEINTFEHVYGEYVKFDDVSEAFQRYREKEKGTTYIVIDQSKSYSVSETKVNNINKILSKCAVIELQKTGENTLNVLGRKKISKKETNLGSIKSNAKEGTYVKISDLMAVLDEVLKSKRCQTKWLNNIKKNKQADLMNEINNKEQEIKSK